MWGATAHEPPDFQSGCDFNPRPPCGGRPTYKPFTFDDEVFQSTPPRVGGDRRRFYVWHSSIGFQSTPPVWGATSELCHRQLLPLKFQSTPPVWGATGDTMLLMASVMQFQSTPPVWGATGTLHTQGRAGASISIHAPRVGGDLTPPLPTKMSRNFNPRPPCGGRHGEAKIQNIKHDFNPRPPCGGRLR